MASYRYCRSDDIALIVRAYNECVRPYVSGTPEMTVDRFKRLLREIDLWTSSCMIASDGDELIAVLMATKRDDAALVHALGVKPRHRRQGHGRHLLTSLGQKLAILGPPKMVAEIPETWEHALGLFRACGYREECTYSDFVLHEPAPEGETSPLVIPITLEELRANDAFDVSARRCWERSPRTLIARADRVRGLAVASPERIEASLLFEPEPAGGSLRLLAFESADAGRAGLWFELLLRHVRREGSSPVTIERVHPREMSFGDLRSCGFEARSATVGFVAEPVPV